MKPFHFKQFIIEHNESTFKVGTDGVLVGAWVNIAEAKTALDIGTGTGLIALMLAQRNEQVKIDAIEIEVVAARQARANVAKSPWAKRVKVHHLNILDFVQKNNQQYDCIICNPPYFNAGTISPKNSKQQSRHTLSYSHLELIEVVVKLLETQGKFSLILPTEEGQVFIEKAKEAKLYLNRLTQVYPKKEKPVERLLMEFGKEEKDLVEEQLIIQYEKRNDYTPDYIALTKDFYLRM